MKKFKLKLFCFVVHGVGYVNMDYVWFVCAKIFVTKKLSKIHQSQLIWWRRIVHYPLWSILNNNAMAES